MLLSPPISRPYPVSAQTAPLKGVNIHFDKFDESLAKRISADKITWLRVDVKFSQPFMNTYRLAEKYKFQLVGILDHETMNYASFTLNDWAEVVKKALKIYPSIHVWEIWNEPTITQYQVGYMDGTPQHYFDLLKSAYAILKGGDSKAFVLGLGGARLYDDADLNFAKQVFALGGGSYMDAMSIHAYPKRLNVGWTWSNYETQWTQLLSGFKQLGKPFWVTETGFNYNQVAEKDQADVVKLVYAFLKKQGAIAYMWYQLIDYGTSEINGLIRTDMSVRPSYSVFVSLA